MTKSLTTEQFIDRAKKKHGNKYDYSQVVYINTSIKVKIFCDKHKSVFEQTPINHLKGQHCPICGYEQRAKTLRLTNLEYIKRAILKHGNLYIYSLVKYKNANTKIKIICKKHGVFEQSPSNHLQGKGCPLCGDFKTAYKQKYSTDEFIKMSNVKRDNIYDYTLVCYQNSITKVKIICKKHGIFEQIPSSHLSGKGCPKCATEIRSSKQRKTTKEFIEQCMMIHDVNRYDYSYTKYVTAKLLVKIICKKHGMFEQRAGAHLKGQGCPECATELFISQRSFTVEQFIEKARKIHGYKYDYKNVVYVNAETKVLMICPLHGEFSQNPNNHLQGKGCSKCNTSKGEQKIINYLDENGINYIHQHKFDECLSPLNNKLIFDFCLPEHNLCIEYDGEFHFHKYNYLPEGALERTQQHDKIKNDYCKQNKIKLLRIPYTKFDRIEAIIDEELNWNYNIIDELF